VLLESGKGGVRNSDVAAAACCCRCPAWQADHYGTPQALVPSLMVERQARQPHVALDWAAIFSRSSASRSGNGRRKLMVVLGHGALQSGDLVQNPDYQLVVQTEISRRLFSCPFKCQQPTGVLKEKNNI